VKLYESFKKKGVLVVGVSDETHELIDQYVKDHKIEFPIARLDASSAFEKSIGTESFPHSAVFAPDGEMIWNGNPAESDGAIGKAAKASKLTPLLPAACAAAEKLMNDGKSGAACLELKKVVAAGTLQGDDATDVQALVDYFEKISSSMWEQAKAALEKKDYLTTAELCDRLVGYAGMEPGDAGKAKLAELRADPVIVKEIDGSKENQKAGRLEKEMEFKDAIKLYKGVVSKFAGSDAAKAAQTRLDVIKSDGLLNMDPNCELCRKGNRPCSKHAKG
jgi:hypothetical protein